MGNIMDDVKGIAPLQGGPRQGVILGSGLNDSAFLNRVLNADWHEKECTFRSLDIDVACAPDHANTFVTSHWADVPVVISRGRPHLNQGIYIGNPRIIRRHMGAMLHLMDGPDESRPRRVIVTQAVGGLKQDAPVGAMVLPTHLFAHTFPSAHYLDPSRGEYPASESLLQQGPGSAIANIVLEAGAVLNLPVLVRQEVRYIPVLGPRFGGQGERSVFAMVFGCSTVGMSGIPELDMICVENLTDRSGKPPIRVALLQIVTDNCDVPSDTGVKEEAKKVAPKVLGIISQLLSADW